LWVRGRGGAARHDPDDRLTTYRAKPGFSITAEPADTALPIVGDGWWFVVQRHLASHLHYAFRLRRC